MNSSVNLLPTEKLEPLGNNMKIVVSSDHTFGPDAVLLASFASPKKKDKALDMGTGCGIIPLIWCKGETKDITAIDIQEKAVSQTEKSIKINCLSERMNVLRADLRELKGILPFGEFDLVTMNPPYKPVGTGIESVSEADKIARHETMCTVNDAVSAAAKLLRFGGRFCMCHRPERLCDIIVAMREGKIEVKRIRFVCEKEGLSPWLVLVEGKRGAKPHVTVENNLIMKNEDGSVTEELRDIFGDFMDGHQ